MSPEGDPRVVSLRMQARIAFEPSFEGVARCSSEGMRIPVRTEIQVLSADEPRGEPLGFTVYENLGPPVGRGLDAEGRPVLITDRDGLIPGDVIALKGGAQMTVYAHKDGLRARGSEGTIALVYTSYTRSEPERLTIQECWCIGAWILP